MDQDTLGFEETLDPDDWGGLRSLGHRMVDDMIDYLQDVRQRPVWQPVPEEVKNFFHQALPEEPQSVDTVYQDFLENVLPYPMGNIHPRFWGWAMGNGTPTAMLAEMLASAMNPNMGGGDHGGVYVESQVLDWLKELFGYPQSASGLLVSGASMANLVGLTVARNTSVGYDMRKLGIRAAPKPLVLYASKEVHSCIQKAVELLGLGSESLRYIPVDDQYRMQIPLLEASIASDLENGMQPFCVVATAGSINTGAFDDMNAIADICQREGIWFHVDGAFGAFASLAEEMHEMVSGMQRADSLALDMHKWMFMPFEAGCILVRSEHKHRQSFSLTPEYLQHSTRGLAGGKSWFTDYGVQLSRGFRALKIWMSIKEQGSDKFRRLIAQNLQQTRYLANLIKAQPQLEIMAPIPLNIICFRYNPGGLDETALNAFNQELLIRIHESGIAVPTYTTLDGRYLLRVCVINHRSKQEDFDIFVKALLEEGGRLAEEFRID